jgi:uncharacterized membrane protein (DUF2068 family)
MALAFTMYALSDNDLPAEVRNVMQFLRVHPANKFFTHLAEEVGSLTEANVLWAAAGTFVYSLFSLVEGGGMMLRISWAGWLAIGESAFFIPIEIYELTRPGRFSWWLASVLLINIFIVWYLYENRQRLFHHHQEVVKR